MTKKCIDIFAPLIGTYSKLMRKTKLSTRIFYGFLVAIIVMSLLFVFNSLMLVQIGNFINRIASAKDDQMALEKFSNSMKVIELHAGYAKRMTQSNLALNISEENQILMIPGIIGTYSEEIEANIKRTAPDQLESFKRYTSDLIKSAQKWEQEKTSGNLLLLIANISTARLATDSLVSDLSYRTQKEIQSIENRKNFTLILSLIINVIIVGIILLIVIPLLAEIKTAFRPLHDASETSLKGAHESLNYATQINESIKQLQQVLNEMVLGISDVAAGAQESSVQSANIIQSAKIANELVGDLAEKANNTHDSLTSYQHGLEQKIVEIKEFTTEVNKALEIVRSNTDVAEKLASQLALLDSNVKEISTILMSVSEITDQTNLLALNASIEAARAGQYGRGFDVVAERIRDLSDQTKKLTAEINKTVNGIQHVSVEVSESLKNVITSVRSSAQEVSVVTDEIAQLEQVFQSLYNSNEEIITSANLQLEGTQRIELQTKEITGAVQNISVQTENVSAAMQELLASSEEINAQLQQIGGMVNETQQVIAKQVELVQLAKETTEKI